MPNTTPRSVVAAWRKGLVAKRLPAALGRATALLAARVESAAPEESGELRASVRATPVRIAGRRISAAVVVGTDHALAVEYGTQDMAPEPFFRPAIRSGLARAASFVEAEAR